MEDTNVKINVDIKAETAVVSLLSSIFSGITHLDTEMVRSNIELGCKGGFSETDRSMRIELGNYIMSHFSLILAGLVVNAEFRETFVYAVQLESALMGESSENVKQARERMHEKKVNRESKGNYVIDFSSYNDMLYRKISDKLLSSFDRISSFDEVLDSFIDGLTESERADISLVASNFMLLFRAFSQNGIFSDYVKEVLHTVQAELDIV